LLLLAGRVRAAEKAALDPALVGTWRAEGDSTSGPWSMIWEIGADGHYAVGGSVSDQGTILACKGRLEETSSKTGRVVAAAYAWKSPNALRTRGRFVFEWKRISSPKTKLERAACRGPGASARKHPAAGGAAAAQAEAPPMRGADEPRPVCGVEAGLDCHDDGDVCVYKGADADGADEWSCCNWWARCEVRKAKRP